MSFENPSDVMYILMTTNTSAIAAVLTSTVTSWIAMGKPDLGMTVNGCLAGLVAITGGCAYVSIEASLLIGALAGVLVVFAVMFFDRIRIDDPVGATSVHLGCGVFGTICVGLFAEEGVTTLSTTNGLFYGGGLQLLCVQLLGIVAVGAFVFVTDRAGLAPPQEDGRHPRFRGRRNPGPSISASTATSPIPISRPSPRSPRPMRSCLRRPHRLQHLCRAMRP